jgi:hypothetical protein
LNCKRISGQTLGAATLTLMVWLMAVGSAQAAPTWLAPTTRSATGADQPDADFDAKGNAVVVWRQLSEGNQVIRAAYRPAGGSFGAAVDLSLGGQNADAPHVDFDGNGNAMFVWYRFNGTSNIIQFRRRAASGVLGPIENLTANGASSTYPQIDTAANGAAVIAWLSNGAPTAVVRSAGGSYGPTAPLSGDAVSASPPTPPIDVAMNASGDALVSWTRNAALGESSYRPAGGSFGSVQAVTAPTGSISVYPKGAVDRFGNATLVFETCSPCSIFSAFRPEGAAENYEGVQTISNVAGGSFLPQVAVDNDGEAIVMWITNAGGPNVVQYRSRPLNAPFRATEDVSAPGATASYPQVRFDANGNAVAIWNRESGLSFRVQSARRPQGGDFGAVTNVSSGGLVYGTYSGFGVDAEGNALVAWFRDTGSGSAVETAGLDAAPPRLSITGAPASGFPGQSLGFTAAASDVWSSVNTGWNFGDGGSAGGTSVSHVFGGAGTFSVRATATDAVGNSRSNARTVQITNPPPPGGGGGGGGGGGAPQPPAVLPSTISSHWNVFRKYTKVDIFAVNDLPAAARVRIQCKTKKKKQQKKGCPYKSRTVATTFPRSRLPVVKPFKKKKMPVGTRITITITAQGFIGKQFRYTIRKRKPPKRPTKLCIPPGGKPARCA